MADSSIPLNREEQTSGMQTDVTAHRSTQQELEYRESQLRTLFDSSYAGIILVDTSGKITVANKRMAEMFNCPQQELVGSSYPEHVHPDQRGSGDEKIYPASPRSRSRRHPASPDHNEPGHKCFGGHR